MKDFPIEIIKRIVDSHKSIIQTMKMMDDGCTKSLLVFEADKFLGIITNGDLQEQLLPTSHLILRLATLSIILRKICSFI